MHGRNPVIVGPAHHGVADVDDERAGDVRNVAPETVARAHLKAAGCVFGAKYGQHAIIRMRPGAQLPGRRRRKLLRVVDDPEGRKVSLELVLEEIRLQPQRSRENAPQRCREARHLIVVAAPSRFEVRRIRRPWIAKKSGPEIQRLLEIACGRLAERCRQRFCAVREVHQSARDETCFADSVLLFGRQVEKCPGGVVNSLCSGFGKAMAGDHEKADLLAGRTDRVDDAGLPGGFPGGERGDIDDRDRPPIFRIPRECHSAAI